MAVSPVAQHSPPWSCCSRWLRLREPELTTTRLVDDDGTVGNGCDDVGVLVPMQIQDAIDDSTAGDTILVCEGDYQGFAIAALKDGLTIRGIAPWKARVVGSGGVLVDIQDVQDTRIQWLTVLHNSDACGDTDALIRVLNAPGTNLRANHLGVLGSENTVSCGYDDGIAMINSPGSEIAWNRVVDFVFNGISVVASPDAGSESPVGVDIHGNTVRYFHAALTARQAQGKHFTVGISIQSEASTVSRNWVRSLPGAGDTPESTPSSFSEILLHRRWRSLRPADEGVQEPRSPRVDRAGG